MLGNLINSLWSFFCEIFCEHSHKICYLYIIRNILLILKIEHFYIVLYHTKPWVLFKTFCCSKGGNYWRREATGRWMEGGISGDLCKGTSCKELYNYYWVCYWLPKYDGFFKSINHLTLPGILWPWTTDIFSHLISNKPTKYLSRTKTFCSLIIIRQHTVKWRS